MNGSIIRPRSTRETVSNHMLPPKATTMLSASATRAAARRTRQNFRMCRLSRHIARRSAKVMDPAYCRSTATTTGQGRALPAGEVDDGRAGVELHLVPAQRPHHADALPGVGEEIGRAHV